MATTVQATRLHIKSGFIAMLFGLLLPLSMAPFNGWPLGVIAISGLAAMVCGQTSNRIRFIHTLCFGLGVYAVGASWIYVSIHDYGQASVALSLLLITPFICFLALLLSVPFICLNRILNSTSIFTLLLVFPSVWTLGEWFRGWVFTGFPWLYLGYGHTDTWLSGWIPVIGALGVSWITAFCGASLTLLFRRINITPRSLEPTNKTMKAAPIIATGITALLLWISGAYLQTVSWTQPSGKPLSVGLIQPATPLSIKWDSDQLSAIFSQLRADTELLLHNDLVVWPESAIPRFRNEVQDFLGTMNSLANDHKTALITGIPTAERDKNPDKPNRYYSNYYNSVIGLGQAAGIYHKQHLVPFGEYVPFEKWLRGSIAFFDLPMSAFSPGPKNQQPITANHTVIATAICYEIAYAELVRASALKANILLTVSNDTWFGQSIGPKQHFQIARIRAIENGKPLIRATNDGISALITADGNVSSTIPPYKRDILEGELQPREGLTPFGNVGTYPILIASILILFAAFLRAYLNKNTAIQ